MSLYEDSKRDRIIFAIMAVGGWEIGCSDLGG